MDSDRQPRDKTMTFEVEDSYWVYHTIDPFFHSCRCHDELGQNEQFSRNQFVGRLDIIDQYTHDMGCCRLRVFPNPAQ